MKQFDTIYKEWFERLLLTLIGFLVFQSNIITVSASTLNSGFTPHSPISETYVQGEIANTVWVKIGLTRVLSKSKVGREREGLLPVVSRAAKGVSQGTNVVYHGLDAAGKVRYVGITSRAPQVRFVKHLGSGTNKALLRYEVVPGASNLSRTGARVFEQRLINQYGLGKNGGQLFNKINSISPSKWHLHGIK